MFDWDEKKRISNFEKHGLDFEDADLVFNAQDKKTKQFDHLHEPRWMDVAQVGRRILTLVYTKRQNIIRIISYRPASRKERSEF